MSAILCNAECYPICDFCTFYDFNGDEEGAYKGDGYCRRHGRAQDPNGACDDFHCRRVAP